MSPREAPAVDAARSSASTASSRRVALADGQPSLRRGASILNVARESILFLLVPATVVMALFLFLYVRDGFAFPVGWDTPKYLWRAELVAALGLDALPRSRLAPFVVNSDRPGLPVLWSVVSSVAGVATVRFAVVFPAVMAAIIGLAAAVLGRVCLRQPRWSIPVFCIGVGASVNVARMAGPGHADNLLISALLPAGAVAALLAAEGKRASAAAIVLLAASVMVHWSFAAVFALILLAVAALSLPESVRLWRGGKRPSATPSGRLVGVVVGAGVLGGLGVASTAVGGPQPPRLRPASFIHKLADELPRYVFPIVAPIAALGAAFQLRGADPGRRRTMVLLLLWVASAPIAILLLNRGVPFPAHRFLAFSLAIPILFCAALLGIGKLTSARGVKAGGIRRPLGVLIVVAGLAGGAFLTGRDWLRTHPWMFEREISQAERAGRYVQRLGGEAPVVFLVDTGGQTPLASTSLAFHVIRSALPPEVIPRSLVYLGDPERFLEGRPTFRPAVKTFDRASRRHWPSVRRALRQQPIALVMPAFNRQFRRLANQRPEWLVDRRLAVLMGPVTRSPDGAADAPRRAMTAAELAFLAGAALLLLATVGSGWSSALMPGGWLERAALAPAFGVAMVVLGGVVADRLGARVAGASAATVVAVVTVGGWVAFALLRGRRDPDEPAAAARA